jgi:hypothetical protein
MNVDLLRSMSYVGLLHWHDIFEICLYSVGIYYFSRWLSRDTQKNLVAPFYAYCVMMCLSYTLGFSSVHVVLLMATPIFFMLFILFHQTTLQKNFITMKKIIPTTAVIPHDWIDGLMRGSLHAVNTSKKLLVLIEDQDDIAQLVTSPMLLYAPLAKDVLEFLIDSPHYQDNKLVVIDTNGYVRAVNAQWQDRERTAIMHGDDEWHAYWIEFTQKTDALFLYILPEQRLFTLYVQGKMLESLSAASVITVLKNFTISSSKSRKQEADSLQGAFNESFTKKSLFKQARP